MIFRRTFLCLILLSTACARKTGTLAQALPVQVQREWRLHDAVDQPLESAPEQLRKLGVRAWLLAHYKANGDVTVRLFQMGSDASAFEAVQTWHDRNAVVFQKGRLFVTVETSALSQEELAGFVQDLQQNLR